VEIKDRMTVAGFLCIPDLPSLGDGVSSSLDSIAFDLLLIVLLVEYRGGTCLPTYMLKSKGTTEATHPEESMTTSETARPRV
jgi:hypothetical protein